MIYYFIFLSFQNHLREKYKDTIKNDYKTNTPSLSFTVAASLGDKSCVCPASTDRELQTSLCTGSQGYKTNNRGLHMCICVCLNVCVCEAGAVTYG